MTPEQFDALARLTRAREPARTAGQAGGHAKNVDAGKAQAERIEPCFRAIAGKWFGVTEAV